jgi:hypothetical protein
LFVSFYLLKLSSEKEEELKIIIKEIVLEAEIQNLTEWQTTKLVKERLGLLNNNISLTSYIRTWELSSAVTVITMTTTRMIIKSLNHHIIVLSSHYISITFKNICQIWDFKDQNTYLLMDDADANVIK